MTLSATFASPRRAVVITGASTGIGEASARALAARDFLVFAGVRKEADAARIGAIEPGRIVPLMIDVTDENSIAAARELVTREVGERGLAGLVNNAGIALGGPLECTPLSVLRRQLDVNVIGAVAVTQAFLPLVRRGAGRIVNMSSISGRVALPFVGQYAASKFALRALSDSLRAELKRWNIEVILIEPGQIDTPIWSKGVAECDQAIAGWDVDSRELYADTFTPLLNHVRRGGGLPPARVAEAVVHALTSRRPKTCYVVGKDSRALRWIGRLPARWRDWLYNRKPPL